MITAVITNHDNLAPYLAIKGRDHTTIKVINMKIETMLKKVDAALDRGAERAKSAVEDYIDAGDLLIAIKAKSDDFDADLEKHNTVSVRQAQKLIRIATHKEQARLEGGSINSLQGVLPQTGQDKVLTEADSATLGYVGTQPAQEGAAAAPVRNADDWHTPSRFTDMALEVMGSIDLDPFSSHQANESVGATRILTEADNAMVCDWASPDTRTVWMNPPYSKGASGKAVDKFLSEYDYGAFVEAIVLMNSSTDTNWFHLMGGAAAAMCFTKGRIAFEDAGGKKSSGNTKGQVFFYYGSNAARFREVFEEVGMVLDTQLVTS